MKQKMFLLALMVVIMSSLWSQYGGEGVFVKITSVEEIVNGYYVVAQDNSSNVMGPFYNTNTSGTNYLTRVVFARDEFGDYVNPATNTVWIIEKLENGNYSFFSETEGVYIGSVNPGSNNVAHPTTSAENNNSQWVITLNNGLFDVQNVATSTRFLRYNATGGQERFSTYTTVQNRLAFYKLQGEVVPIPSISNVTQILTPPVANQNLPISATVTYEGGSLSGVALRYFIEGTENTVAMTAASNVYTGNIPASQLLNGTRVELRVVVTYGDAQTVMSPEQHFFVGTTPILKIRENLENGVPRFENYLVGIKGVSLNSAGVLSTAATDFFIQDDTAGFGVYRQGVADPPFVDVLQGYEYNVVGRIIQFRGRAQIDPQTIEQLGIGVPVQPYINTTAFFTNYATAERYEGSLIGIKNVSLAETSPAWPTSGSAISVILTDGNGTIDLRVLPALQGAGPTFPADFVALLSQYKTDNANPPFHTGYQLFVRSLEDFYPTGVLPVTLTSFTVSAVSEKSVQIRWTTESESNMSGYNVLRGTTADIDRAIAINPALILANNIPTAQIYQHIDNEVLTEIEYFYWLQAIENDGSKEHFGPVTITIPKEGEEPTTDKTMLFGVYPNPLGIDVQANFSVRIKDTETATLKIFNVRGQLVKEFPNIAAGEHNIIWDGKDNHDKETANGVYFYQLSSQSYFSVQRMVILK